MYYYTGRRFPAITRRSHRTEHQIITFFPLRLFLFSLLLFLSLSPLAFTRSANLQSIYIHKVMRYEDRKGRKNSNPKDADPLTHQSTMDDYESRSDAAI